MWKYKMWFRKGTCKEKISFLRFFTTIWPIPTKPNISKFCLSFRLLLRVYAYTLHRKYSDIELSSPRYSVDRIIFSYDQPGIHSNSVSHQISTSPSYSSYSALYYYNTVIFANLTVIVGLRIYEFYLLYKCCRLKYLSLDYEFFRIWRDC